MVASKMAKVIFTNYMSESLSYYVFFGTEMLLAIIYNHNAFNT